MKSQYTSTTLRRFGLTATAVFCLSLAACGGGGNAADVTSAAAADTSATAAVATAASTLALAGTSDGTASVEVGSDKASIEAVAKKSATPAAVVPSGVTTVNTLQVGLTLTGYPHKVDVYRPAGATRAIVYLHGMSGYNWQMANYLHLNSNGGPPTMDSVNWAWLTKNNVIAIFPQGQTPYPGAPTQWSDYVHHSGQDDVGFLKALSTYALANFGATEISISGHSDGGVMSARVWCEATTSYKAYVSLAGPMPSDTYPLPAATCIPAKPAPYYMIVGGADTNITQFSKGLLTPSSQDVAVGLTNSILLSEWTRHKDRAQIMCGASVSLTPTSIQSSGESWTACNGRIGYQVLTLAQHPIASIEQYDNMQMIDMINQFVQ